MIARRSSIPLWFRLSAAAWGILVLVWLPFEDLDERRVIGLAAILCALVAGRMLLGDPAGERKSRSVWFAALAAGLAGLAVAPVGILLMVLKSGLHGHPVPDFTPHQVFSVLQRVPFWTASGLLAGLGIGIVRRVNR